MKTKRTLRKPPVDPSATAPVRPRSSTPIVQVPREAVDAPPNELASRPDSILSLYMREVGEVPLLTIEEENALAARIKLGDDAASDHMIRANLRLVVKIAREYDGLGLPLLDLINEGNMGLMKAVERFDPAKGGKLSTYSSWWIKQSMRRAIANQGRTIRLPIHAIDKLSRATRMANEFREDIGREPTHDELADLMGVRSSRLSEIRTAAIRPVSLDAPVGDDDSSLLAERVADDGATNPYQALEEKSLLGMLGHLVERLDAREQKILGMRFGLNGQKELTLEEIGATFGLTRERIRQLQNGALFKLRQMIEEDAMTAVAA